jgi:hypothetical protein
MMLRIACCQSENTQVFRDLLLFGWQSQALLLGTWTGFPRLAAFNGFEVAAI